MRWVAVLAIVAAMVASIGTVQGQEATPTAPAFTDWVQDRAERSWFDVNRAFTGDWGLLDCIAYRFDTREHANASLKEAIDHFLSSIRFHPEEELKVRRVSAPQIGDESQLWFRDETEEDPSAVAIGFVDDEYMVILAISSRNKPLTNETAIDLLAIAERIAGRRPSNDTPTYNGDIMIGGLFDLLPGYEDVPVGMTKDSEGPIVFADPSATPTS